MKINTLILIVSCLLISTTMKAEKATGIKFAKDEIELKVGDSFSLNVNFITDSTEVRITGLSFSVIPDSLGKVENETFFALKSGKGWIKAVYESYTDSIKVEVERNKDTADNDFTENDPNEQINDTTGMNNIYISRVLPSGKVLPAHLVKEGQTYVIGGLPSPMNILNGGEIFFPVGSLNEDIKIYIELPKYAEIVKGNSNKEDSVRFKNKKVLNSVAFHVFVNDSLISPYYFDLPLEVSIPFKSGLIKKLGLDASKLSLFYATNSLDLDQYGITDVVIDSAANFITSKVAHFSNLVIAEGNGTTNIDVVSLPLVSMYPNPVGDYLNIKFSEKLEGKKTVSVYKILGQPFVKEINASDELQLNMSGLPAGVYYIKVTNEFNVVVSSKPVLKK